MNGTPFKIMSEVQQPLHNRSLSDGLSYDACPWRTQETTANAVVAQPHQTAPLHCRSRHRDRGRGKKPKTMTKMVLIRSNVLAGIAMDSGTQNENGISHLPDFLRMGGV